jgi:hypothetical protein
VYVYWKTAFCFLLMIICETVDAWLEDCSGPLLIFERPVCQSMSLLSCWLSSEATMCEGRRRTTSPVLMILTSGFTFVMLMLHLEHASRRHLRRHREHQDDLARENRDAPSMEPIALGTHFLKELKGDAANFVLPPDEQEPPSDRSLFNEAALCRWSIYVATDIRRFKETSHYSQLKGTFRHVYMPDVLLYEAERKDASRMNRTELDPSSPWDRSRRALPSCERLFDPLLEQ